MRADDPNLPILIVIAQALGDLRDERDHLTSHDLEDVLSVVDGRASLAQEMEAASPEMQTAVRQELARLLGTPNFINRLPGLIADADRTPVVLERLRALALAQQP
jgi:HEAT repeat protein